MSEWTTNASPGVEATIHPDSGQHGRGMRLDFDFHGHDGYAIVHRDLDVDLPANYEFSFAVRGDAPTNTLELKLIDSSRANVWWSNNADFVFPREWRTIARKKRQICFAWGPLSGVLGANIRHVAAIELAVTAGSGGKGSVWIDDLALTALDPDSPFEYVAPSGSPPIAGTWVSVPVSGQGVRNTMTFAADGTVISAFGLAGDFSYSVNGDSLTTVMTDPMGLSERQTTQFRIERDSLIQKDGDGPGHDVRMTRLRPATDGVPAIVGTWRYPFDSVRAAFVAFTPTGRMLIQVPTTSCAGTWTDTGTGRFTLRFNRMESTWSYSVADSVLVMKSDKGGKELRYTRLIFPQ